MTIVMQQILGAMSVYLIAVAVIGILYSKKASANSENYFLGGRTLGPWVAAMSAEASDMSGWLLMGLPGLAYWTGLADATWTAIGLAAGTYINWLIVSRRLRRYSTIVDAITIPEFFSKRFHEKKKPLQLIASLFIIIFFAVYAASCLVTFGKLFSTLFNWDYTLCLIIGAAFVLFYTYLGGFLAESVSDLMQAIVMIVSLVVVVAVGCASVGGLSAVIDNANSIGGFWNFFTSAVSSETVAGTFEGTTNQTALGIISSLAWGLGYFGMPQVLLRFMAIRKEKELRKSRIIAMVWVLISLAVAVFIGIIGRSVLPDAYTSNGAAESVFIDLSTKLLPPIVAGLMMAGILAASMSSSDSYLLIASSAVSRDIYKGIIKKDASDKKVMLLSRITLCVLVIVAVLISLDENSVIFKIVSFAWAGFGATFGPLMLFSLFWKRTTHQGAIAGMISGGLMVFIWKLLISKLGGVFAIYELLPAFIISSLFILIVSLCTEKPGEAIERDFDTAAAKIQ